jgi:hypothetical protein
VSEMECGVDCGFESKAEEEVERKGIYGWRVGRAPAMRRGGPRARLYSYPLWRRLLLCAKRKPCYTVKSPKSTANSRFNCSQAIGELIESSHPNSKWNIKDCCREASPKLGFLGRCPQRVSGPYHGPGISIGVLQGRSSQSRQCGADVSFFPSQIQGQQYALKVEEAGYLTCLRCGLKSV